MFGFVSVPWCVAFFLSIRTLARGRGAAHRYLGIVMVVVWLWLKRGGAAAPIVGAVLSIPGLVLVLDVFGAQGVDGGPSGRC